MPKQKCIPVTLSLRHARNARMFAKGLGKVINPVLSVHLPVQVSVPLTTGGAFPDGCHQGGYATQSFCKLPNQYYKDRFSTGDKPTNQLAHYTVEPLIMSPRRTFTSCIKSQAFYIRSPKQHRSTSLQF